MVYTSSHGYGVAHFAKIMLEDKGLSLAGKKCLIVGSNYVSSVLMYCECAIWYILCSILVCEYVYYSINMLAL